MYYGYIRTIECETDGSGHDIILATRMGFADGHAIQHFDPKQEEWPQYMEQLEQFFEANDITGENKAAKRRATFLSVIGMTPYKLLRSLIAPTKPTDKTFEDPSCPSCRPYQTLQSTAIRGHATVLLQFSVEERGTICGSVRHRTTSSC